MADRRDKIWTEQDIAAVPSVASDEIRLALTSGAVWPSSEGFCVGRSPCLGPTRAPEIADAPKTSVHNTHRIETPG